MTNLPRRLRDEVDRLLPSELTAVAETVSDAGDTVKFLSAIDGGHEVETVLMLYRDRATACISSQAGCAMGCGFCATGQGGFARHLTTGEIVEQVIVASRRARATERRLSNVVFMGMGEPLANEASVWAAIQRIHDDLGLSARHITVSTVGVVPGIRALAARGLPVTLAVSIHAANDALRDELVPLNRRYPLDAVVGACQQYIDATGRRVSFEWAMIDGVNDRPQDAVELADLARRLRPAAHVNLIPLNPTPGWPTTGSPASRVRQFRDRLDSLGVGDDRPPQPRHRHRRRLRPASRPPPRRAADEPWLISGRQRRQWGRGGSDTTATRSGPQRDFGCGGPARLLFDQQCRHGAASERRPFGAGLSSRRRGRTGTGWWRRRRRGGPRSAGAACRGRCRCRRRSRSPHLATRTGWSRRTS